MNKWRKHHWLVTLLAFRCGITLYCLIAAPLVVGILRAQEFTYMITNGTITITGYTGPGGNVVVPDTINSLPVTSIGDWAFGGNTNLEGIALPNSVTSVGNSAFANCYKLTAASLGNSIATIGDSAFAWSGLASILLPDSLNSIGVSAFSECPGLTNVDIPAGVTNSQAAAAFSFDSNLIAINVAPLNPSYSSVDGVFFDKAQTAVFVYPQNKAGSGYVIPQSVTTISGGAFNGCAGLSVVTFGSNVVTIGGGSFGGCSSLQSAVLPNTVKSIGAGAFYGCFALTSVTIPDGVTNIGSTAFFSSGLTNVTIPGSVTVLPNNVFGYCGGLNNLILGDGLQVIEDNAFTLCSNLKSAQIPDSVTSIGVEAFYNCYRLTAVTLGAGLTNLGVRAFSGAFSLAAFDVAPLNPAFSTDDGVLFDKTRTTLVECPGNRWGIYTVPNGVTAIGDYAFYQCNGFSNVVFPDTLTQIGIGAFYQSALTTLTIPASVTLIGGFAFLNSIFLQSMYFEGNAPAADMTVFGVSPTTVYYMPGAAGWGPSFSNRPTALWVRPNPVFLSGLTGFTPANGPAFTISWASNTSVVIEASTNVVGTSWVPVSTNLLTGGWCLFNDLGWTNYPARYFRVRSP